MQTPSPSLTNSDYKFVEVYGIDFRPCVKDMCDTVTRLGLWEWYRTYNPPEDSGFMYSSHSNVEAICNGLSDDCHSGATFGYCMRLMQAIAKRGFDNWNNEKLPG